MMLSEAAKVTSGTLMGADVDIVGVSIDSRSIKAGETFLALQGPNFDGHNFVETAETRGAIASVVQRPVKNVQLSQLVVGDTHSALTALAVKTRKLYKGKVAAITGSSGKTTVKGLLNSICERAGGCVATKGNLNNLIGVPLSVLRLKNDTPFGVFEAGTSIPGEIPALAAIIQADVALVNNVLPAHVQGFGTVENIAKEKTALFSALENSGTAIVNLDDPQVSYFLERSQHVKRVGFSVRANPSHQSACESVIFASNIVLDNVGSPRFTLGLAGAEFTCQLRLIGQHNVANAAAAAAMAYAMGIEAHVIAEGLQQYAGENGRMQLCRGAKGNLVVNDSYNANPSSVKAAIDYLTNFDEPVLVLGDLGELGPEESDIHSELGTYAKNAGLSALYATGILAAETANAFGSGANWCESQSELIEKLKEQITSNHTVLVKGSRSSRMENIVAALCQSVEES